MYRPCPVAPKPRTRRRGIIQELSISWILPSVNNHRAFHAELVMNSAYVVESAGSCEGHAKSGYTRIGLREVCPILRRRRQESGIHTIGSRAYYRLPRPLRGRRDICRRRPRVCRLRTKGHGVVYRWVETPPLNLVPNSYDDCVPHETHQRCGL